MTIWLSIIYCHSICGVEVSISCRRLNVRYPLSVCTGVTVLRSFLRSCSNQTRMALRQSLGPWMMSAVRCIKTFHIYDPWTSPQQSVRPKKKKEKRAQTGRRKKGLHTTPAALHDHRVFVQQEHWMEPNTFDKNVKKIWYFQRRENNEASNFRVSWLVRLSESATTLKRAA